MRPLARMLRGMDFISPVITEALPEMKEEPCGWLRKLLSKSHRSEAVYQLTGVERIIMGFSYDDCGGDQLAGKSGCGRSVPSHN